MEQPDLKENHFNKSSLRVLGLLLTGFALGVAIIFLLQPERSTLEQSKRKLEVLLERQQQQLLGLENELESFKKLQGAVSHSDERVSALEEELAFIKSHARSLQAEADASSLRTKQILSLKQMLKKTREDLEISNRENATLAEKLHLVNSDYESLTHPNGVEGPKLLRSSHLVRKNELSEYFDGALTVAVTKIGLEAANLRINAEEKTHALGVGQMLEVEIGQKTYGFRIDRLRHDSFIYMSVLLLDI